MPASANTGRGGVSVRQMTLAIRRGHEQSPPMSPRKVLPEEIIRTDAQRNRGGSCVFLIVDLTRVICWHTPASVKSIFAGDVRYCDVTCTRKSIPVGLDRGNCQFRGHWRSRCAK